MYPSVEKHNRHSPVVGCRVTYDVKAMIQRVAKERGETVDTYLRSIILPQVLKDAKGSGA